MKIPVNDDTGSRLVAVLRLDGTPAVEGEDYVVWEGPYHENGKWGFTEGGVALREGIVLKNQRSPHHACDNRKIAVVVSGNRRTAAVDIMGPLDTVPERPAPKEPFTPEVWDRLIETILAWADPEIASTVRERWARIAPFL